MSRRLLVPLAVLGAVLLAAGVAWAFADRAADPSAVATALLLAGTVVGLGTLNATIGLERRSDGLVVPEGARLPTPHWTGPAALVGLCDLVGGLWSSPAVAVVGALLLLVGLVGFGWTLTGRREGLDRGTVVAARRILAFGRRHGAPPAGTGADRTVDAVLEHVGRDVVRMVLVAPDGAYGDVVVRGADRAAVAARLAGAAVHDGFPRELAARLRVGGYEWRRMAGAQLGGRRSES